MKDKFLKDFQDNINQDVYVRQHNGKVLKMTLEEPGHYRLRLRYTVVGDHAVSFRLEDIKELAQYLAKEKRGAGKDNDLMLIDDNVYQFEVKMSTTVGGHRPEQQLNGGRKWLEHLLPLASKDHYAEAGKVYDIYVNVLPESKHDRPTLARGSGNCRLLPDLDDENPYESIQIIDSRIPANLDGVLRKIKGTNPNGSYALG